MIPRAYNDADAAKWDEFCGSSHSGTFLHTRRFLSYHGDRFSDQSVVLSDGSGELLGLFPAAVDPQNPNRVVSHPGASYGGLLTNGKIRGELVLSALSMLCDHYYSLGFERILYKAVPHIYHRIPCQDDLYALFRLGASRVRCDLSATVDMSRRLPLTSRRRRSLKKAEGANLTISTDQREIRGYWKVLEENLASKHGVEPTHTVGEIAELQERFPDQIKLVTASRDGEVVAGLVLFLTATVAHAQYLAASAAGYAINALDLVIHEAIESVAGERVRWFDFGISNEAEGQVLNTGLYDFKCEFGGGSAVHEFYELSTHNDDH